MTGEAAVLKPAGRFAEWRRPARVRYVVLDVDGTLVGPDGGVSDAVAAAAAEVRDAGIPVGFATGRLSNGVRPLQATLGLTGPHIVLNGSQVRHGGEPIATWPLEPEQLEALLDYTRRHDLYCELYLDEGFLVTRMDERFRPHWDEIIGQPDGVVGEEGADLGRVVKATVVAFDEEERQRMTADLAALGLAVGAATSPITPDMTYLNITHPDADKGRGLAVAADHLGVSLEDVVAIGDSLNDRPMLEVAGTAIAMGDAPDEILAAAHLYAPDVLADGAAVALRAVLDWR